MKSKALILTAAGAAVCVAGATASAAVVTFAGAAHGEIVTNQFAGDGVIISAINPNRNHDLAIIFDSLETGTLDPDLEGPDWDGGNLPSDTILGNLLIISQTSGDNNNDGIIDNPNDEGNRPAGQLIFDFASTQTEFGFDLVDVESISLEDGGVLFYLDGQQVASVGFADLVDSNSAFYDATIEFGDNTANRIQPFTAGALGIAGFDRAVIMMGGSGGVDNVNFVPTPGAVGLLAAAGLLSGRRRRAS